MVDGTGWKAYRLVRGLSSVTVSSTSLEKAGIRRLSSKQYTHLRQHHPASFERATH